jgi:hypothetical protein
VTDAIAEIIEYHRRIAETERDPDFKAFHERAVIALSAAPTPTSTIREHWLYSGKPSEHLTDREVISDIIACANSWEPRARLLGNIRAGDIVRILAAVLVASTAATGQVQGAGSPTVATPDGQTQKSTDA